MKKVNYEPLSPLVFLQRARIFYKNEIAIIDHEICKTYQEFYDDCICLAKSLKIAGVNTGDCIAYLSRNNYQMLVAHYAIPMLGAILIPINIRYEVAVVSHIHRQSSAKILFIESNLLNEEYLDIVEKTVIINQCNNIQYINEILDYFDFIKIGENLSKLPELEDFDENMTITINYTSGTSGQPKGAMYSHRSTYLNAIGECLNAKLSNDSVYLWVLPMFHCNGWCFTWAVTAVGATHICIDNIQPEAIVKLIVENEVTHLCAAPTILIKLNEAKNFYLLKNIKDLKIITAGASPSPTLIKRYEENNIKLIHVYGLTETHGPHTICEEQFSWKHLSKVELAKIKASQGIACVHSTFLRVVDKHMQDVPADGISMGEIIMRGNNIMKGYYKDPESTNKAFENGWFHSGDVAVVRPDGYIEIKDRLKDIIISGGENISSIEIENLLYQHPAVHMVAVVPQYDEEWGEVPHAIIELKKKASVHEKEIIAYCRARLAHYKCPKIVTFQVLPKTSTGKIQKYILKQKYYYISSNKNSLTKASS